MATATRSRGTRDEQHAAAQRAGRRILAEEGTVCVFQGALLALVRADVLTANAYRVLFWLMGDMHPGNVIYYSAAECGRRINMPYATCLRAWNLLRLHGLLRREYNEDGSIARYRVAPHLCWKGRPWKASVMRRSIKAAERLQALAAQWEGDE
jgi:hypothetical protein